MNELENKILSRIISAQIGTCTSMYAPDEAVLTTLYRCWATKPTDEERSAAGWQNETHD